MARKALKVLGTFTAVLCLALAAAAEPADQQCLACHGEPGMKSEAGRSLHVDAAKHGASVHGELSCSTCHAGVKEYPHPKPMPRVACASCHDEPAARVPKSAHGVLKAKACTSCHGPAHEVQRAASVVPQSCAACHAERVREYQRGVHAAGRKTGDLQAPTCLACHESAHQILPASDSNSKVYRTNIPGTCGACHGQKFVMERSGFTAETFVNYQESVHGKAVAAGSMKASVCTDCHGSHAILPPGDSQSPIFKFNVPMTCAKCHSQVQQEFMQSVHGQAVARGNWQAPVCTDCHGIHSIKTHLDPNSSVAAANLALITCARCHEGVRLAQEFGVEGRRSTTYLASYHGLASKLGSQIVANCASCHGVHNILPSSDPRSTISRANLVRTCGQCHPGVGENFALSKVHVNAPLSADTGSVAVRWIRRFYVGMIVAVIGAMLLHNFIIWRRKAILRRNAQHRAITRMNVIQRVQHILLLSSFFALVVTGFALKYPDSWFAGLLAMGERVRGIIHRVAGVILIGVGVFHVLYVIFSRGGRKLVVDFLPVPKDATDVWGVLRHYLGLSREKPVFPRFNYAEKAEYWALVWGLMVMAGTGIMLWAKLSVGSLLPRWWLDVATAIHFYEAVLATLAIVVWHFYQVFFDPDVYPMNWAWWDGKMSVEHYREEHGLDSATLLAAAEAERAEEAAEPPEARPSVREDTGEKSEDTGEKSEDTASTHPG
jgi:cytochrome b subunit of formate dehydrogenase